MIDSPGFHTIFNVYEANRPSALGRTSGMAAGAKRIQPIWLNLLYFIFVYLYAHCCYAYVPNTS